MASRFGVRAVVLLFSMAVLYGQTIRVDVVLCQVIATVRAPDGRLVTNLKPEDFVVELNGVPQPIAHFAQDRNIPLSVGLVIDSSMSMDRVINAARDAGATFIRGMRVRDEAFLMTFD